ncbi:MAG: outer membrane porin [Rhodobacteraceae bacterium HLUCCA12]|nr:MAG: outer membrane porin [Rhodobacteraceae bacterium HLUCCA12]
MKKILLASAALALSAGVAHSQAVTIGGQGRMGVQYNNNGFVTRTGALTNWRTESRLQLNFSAAVQADHGLSFGGFTRLRLQTNGATATQMTTQDFSGHRVWVEANGLRLTFGNQDGAIATTGTAMGYLGGCGVGYEGGQQCADSVGLLGAVTWFNSNGGGGNNTGNDQTLQASYTMGDWQAAISGERSNGVEVAVRGRFDAFTVAAGYQQDRGLSPRVFTASGHYNGGNWGVGAIVARIGTGGGATTNYALNANADLGGGNLYGFVGRLNSDTAYGLSYSYGLGGGASITAGAERVGGATDTTTASVGVAFNF